MKRCRDGSCIALGRATIRVRKSADTVKIPYEPPKRARGPSTLEQCTTPNCAARTTDPWTALGWATAGYLAVGAAAYVWAGDIRGRVRTAEVHVLASKNDVPTLIRSRVIRSLGTTMARADEQLAAGEIRSADYEATWWRVYDRLTPGVFEAGIR